ncbi:MAG: hypothetical protein KGI75_23135 [Rhizobiaceae bacterium]|nr:hypothetical protein [Rhizobiaceae bacterium]
MKKILAEVFVLASVALAGPAINFVGATIFGAANADEINANIVSDGVMTSATSHQRDGSKEIDDSSMSIFVSCNGNTPVVQFTFFSAMSTVEPKAGVAIPVEMRLKFIKKGLLSAVTTSSDSIRMRDLHAALFLDNSVGADFAHDQLVVYGFEAQDLVDYMTHEDTMTVATSNLKTVYTFDLSGFGEGARNAASACLHL